MPLLSKKYPVGLDISNLSLKLVQLKKIGKKIQLVSFNSIKLEEEIFNDGEVNDINDFSNAIKELFKTVKGNKISTKEVVACLPETLTFIKLIELRKNKISGSKDQEPFDFEDLLKQEVQKHIPYNLNELYYDWQKVDERDGVEKVLFGAAPQKIVDDYHQAINSAGLIPIAFEIEAASIIHSLFSECRGKDEKDEAIAVLDVGASRSSFIVYDHGTIQFSLSIPVSGELITKLLQDTLQISYEQAERAKIVCGLDNQLCKGALKEILFKTLFQLINKIIDSINFYYDHFLNCNKISKIILCGGTANLKNLPPFLEKNLNIKIETANPWLNLASVIDKKLLENNAGLGYTTAIGLALREIKLEISKSR